MHHHRAADRRDRGAGLTQWIQPRDEGRDAVAAEGERVVARSDRFDGKATLMKVRRPAVPAGGEIGGQHTTLVTGFRPRPRHAVPRFPAGQPDGGFTLIELLIAMFILAMGLTFVFALFPVGIYSTRDNVDWTRAGILGRSAFARIRAVRLYDQLDTADRAILASSTPDTPGALVTPEEGFGPADVRDTDDAQYCWLASYARLDPAAADSSDTSPADALAVRVAILRVGLVYDAADVLTGSTGDFRGRLVLSADSDQARIIQPPTDRRGFVTGNFFCDRRSGRWYRIQDLRDTGDGGALDVVILDRPADYDSDGRAFENAIFPPNVVAVLDGAVSP